MRGTAVTSPRKIFCHQRLKFNRIKFKIENILSAIGIFFACARARVCVRVHVQRCSFPITPRTFIENVELLVCQVQGHTCTLELCNSLA